MNTQQRERLKIALANWPQKTTAAWSKCAIGFLCEKADIPMPSDTFIMMEQLTPRLERYYGLPRALQERLVWISVKIWRTKRTRSRLQKQALRTFLQTQT